MGWSSNPGGSDPAACILPMIPMYADFAALAVSAGGLAVKSCCACGDLLQLRVGWLDQCRFCNKYANLRPYISFGSVHGCCICARTCEA